MSIGLAGLGPLVLRKCVWHPVYGKRGVTARVKLQPGYKQGGHLNSQRHSRHTHAVKIQLKSRYLGIPCVVCV